MNIWRLQTKTSGNGVVNIGEYCYNNRLIAIGWSLLGNSDRKKIKTWDDYQELCKTQYGKIDPNIKNLHDRIKPNDLVWIKDKGIYYLGRVTKKSVWSFNSSIEATEIDASNQISDIDFVTIGDESAVPGIVVTSFIRNRTLQRIKKNGAREFSCYIYDKLSGNNIYEDELKLAYNKENFYNLISTDDCEDLVVSYLFSKYNYMVIPSTAKKGTELYEFVMKDICNNKNVYIQVKKGNVSLYSKYYEHLCEEGKGREYLLSTEGNVMIDNNTNINRIDPDDLFEFLKVADNEKYLPESIITWKRLLEEGN